MGLSSVFNNTDKTRIQINLQNLFNNYTSKTRWMLIILTIMVIAALGISFSFFATTELKLWGMFTPRILWVPVPRWLGLLCAVLVIGGHALIIYFMAQIRSQRRKGFEAVQAKKLLIIPSEQNLSIKQKKKEIARIEMRLMIQCSCIFFLFFVSYAFYLFKDSDIYHSRGQTTLHNVAMISATEGWAVGVFEQHREQSGSFNKRGVIWQYNQGRWEQNIQLADKYSSLEDIVALPNGEAWAVGDNSTILHHSGGNWELIHKDNESNTLLKGISMSSSAEGWAVGFAYLSTLEGTIWHYSQGKWKRDLQFKKGLLDVSALPNGEAWAVGFGGSILHYQDGSWNTVASPTSNPLGAVSMISSDEGWAVGNYGTLLHYSNGVWSLEETEIPSSEHLRDIKMISANEGWIVGSEGNIWHYTQGSWQRFAWTGKHVLNGVAVVPGDSSEGWIVGDGLVADGNDALTPTILRFHDEAWNFYK